MLQTTASSSFEDEKLSENEDSFVSEIRCRKRRLTGMINIQIGSIYLSVSPAINNTNISGRKRQTQRKTDRHAAMNLCPTAAQTATFAVMTLILVI